MALQPGIRGIIISGKCPCGLTAQRVTVSGGPVQDVQHILSKLASYATIGSRCARTRHPARRSDLCYQGSVNEGLTSMTDSCSAWAEDRMSEFSPSKQISIITAEITGFSEPSSIESGS